MSMRRTFADAFRGPDWAGPTRGEGGEALPRSGWRACRAFAATSSSVPGARRWLREVLLRAGVEPEALVPAELLISELVTNAVQHGRGSKLMVSVQAGENVEAGVRDDAAALPNPRLAEPWEAGGRGLAIVAALADEWGTCPASDGRGAGKWVWFRLRRPFT